MLIIIIFLQGAHLIMSERNETFLWTRGSEAVMTEMTLKDDCATTARSEDIAATNWIRQVLTP